MSGGDLPPRQKMIGMMYLVLLALLALNVSKSILEAFVGINDGIVTTTKTFAMSNDVIYRAFDKAALQSPAAKVWSKKAHKVKKMAEDMYQHIHNIKTALIADVERLINVSGCLISWLAVSTVAANVLIFSSSISNRFDSRNLSAELIRAINSE